MLGRVSFSFQSYFRTRLNAMNRQMRPKVLAVFENSFYCLSIIEPKYLGSTASYRKLDLLRCIGTNRNVPISRFRWDFSE